MSDNQKIYIAKGIYLEFKEEANGKYSFSSNDPEVQNWCESVKNKEVKGKDIKFVVGAAKKHKFGEKSNIAKKRETIQKKNVVSTRSAIDPNIIGGWNENIAQAFNLYCQKTGMKYPDFQTLGVVQGNGGQIVTVKMKLEDGSSYTAQASNKQLAKNEAIKQYAQEVLGVKFKTENKNDNVNTDLRLDVAGLLVEYPYDYKRAIDRTFKPKYMTEQVRSEKGQVVKCTAVFENGTKVFGWGENKNEAQQNAAKEFLKSRLKIDVDNFEQFNMVDEMKAWSALEALSSRELEPMFDNYETKKKLPDIVVDYLEQQIAEAKEQAEQEKLYQQNQDKYEQKELELKKQLKQSRFSLIDKQSDIVSVKKSNDKNGRSYDMVASDGTKYHVSITYGNEVKKKGVYKNQERFWDGLEPDEYVDKDVSTLNVSCDITKNDKKESFTLKTTSPHLHSENPYRLDLMFLANLNMTIKNTSVGHLEKDALQENQQKLQNVSNAYLVLKLLSAANDQIVQSPKLLKQWRSNKKRVHSLSNEGR